MLSKLSPTVIKIPNLRSYTSLQRTKLITRKIHNGKDSLSRSSEQLAKGIIKVLPILTSTHFSSISPRIATRITTSMISINSFQRNASFWKRDVEKRNLEMTAPYISFVKGKCRIYDNLIQRDSTQNIEQEAMV